MLTNIQIQDITNQRILISDLTDEDLLEFCKFAKSANEFVITYKIGYIENTTKNTTTRCLHTYSRIHLINLDVSINTF